MVPSKPGLGAFNSTASCATVPGSQALHFHGAGDTAREERSTGPPPEPVQPVSAKRIRPAGESAASTDSRAAEHRKGSTGGGQQAPHGGTAPERPRRKQQREQPNGVSAKASKPNPAVALKVVGELAKQRPQAGRKKPRRQEDAGSKPLPVEGVRCAEHPGACRVLVK